MSFVAGLPRLTTPPPPDGYIAVEPELFRLAHKHGAAPAFRIWTEVRNLDTTGQGWIAQQDLLNCAQALDLHERSILRILNDSPDWFMVAVNGRIFYTAQAKLLNLYHWQPTRNVGTAHIPSTSLSSLGKFNAACYGAWFTLHTQTLKDGTFITAPLSRAILTKLFDVDKTTLRKWEKKSGTNAEANYGLSPYGETDGHAEVHCTCGHYFWSEDIARRQVDAGQRDYHGHEPVTPAMHRAHCPDHTFIAVRRRPNSYLPPRTTTGRRRPSFKNQYKQLFGVQAPVNPVSTTTTHTHAKTGASLMGQGDMGEKDGMATLLEQMPNVSARRYLPWKKTEAVPPILLARCQQRQLWTAVLL